MPRDYYNPADPKSGRPTVVVRVLQAERACILFTRTSEVGVVRRDDVLHGPDAALGCDTRGWWQPWRVHRVSFSAYDDENTIKYSKLDAETLERVVRAYQEPK
jgi:hypothetical protein